MFVCARNEDGATNIYNIAQDIVFGVSKGMKLTKKHIGFGLTLYQATRSKRLVDLSMQVTHLVWILFRDSIQQWQLKYCLEIGNEWVCVYTMFNRSLCSLQGDSSIMR